MQIKQKKNYNILKFDIIILDVMMPGQNGYELTEEIKKKLKFQLYCLLQKVKLKIELKD